MLGRNDVDESQAVVKQAAKTNPKPVRISKIPIRWPGYLIAAMFFFTLAFGGNIEYLVANSSHAFELQHFYSPESSQYPNQGTTLNITLSDFIKRPRDESGAKPKGMILFTKLESFTGLDVTISTITRDPSLIRRYVLLMKDVTSLVLCLPKLPEVHPNMAFRTTNRENGKSHNYRLSLYAMGNKLNHTIQVWAE